MYRALLAVVSALFVTACADDSLQLGSDQTALRSQAGASLRALLVSASSVDVVRFGQGEPEFVSHLKGTPASRRKVDEAIAQRDVPGNTLLLVIVQSDESVLGVPISAGPDSPGVRLDEVEEAVQ